MRRQLPRTTDAPLEATVLAAGEVAYSTDLRRLRIGDGLTTGGLPLLTGQAVSPSRWRLGSDADDGPSFQRMIDWMEARNLAEVQLDPILYDTSSTAIVVNTPIQMQGCGFSERGHEGTPVTGGSSVRLRGTRIRSNRPTASGASFRWAIGSAGAAIDGILFAQTHPDPGSGWAPNDWDWLFHIDQTYGALVIGRIGLLGINRFMKTRTAGRIEIGSVVGQCFRQGFDFDDCRDIVRIDYVDLWDHWSADPYVLAFQQINNEAFRLGRIDGLFIGTSFVQGANNALHYVQTAAGFATDINFQNFWAECTRNSILVGEPGTPVVGAQGNFGSFNAQGAGFGTATPLTGSCGLKILPSCNGGLFTFGPSDTSYMEGNGFRNESTSAVDLDGRWIWGHMAGGATPWFSPYVPIVMSKRDIGDGSGAVSNELHVARMLTNRDFPIGAYASDAAAGAAGVTTGQAYWDGPSNTLKKKT